MKNRKGFTLIEIIGAVIILGIIALIAFNTFLGNLKGFRDDYYNNIVRTLSESGKEFFNDNRNYRPGGVLGAQKVSLGMLESKGYLDEVVDYKGKVCDKNNSYVLVVKEGKDDYSYHTCLKCIEDGFDNTTDSYCDPAWLDPTTITYGIGDPPEIYVYLGTSREKLKELLEVPVSYVRTNSAGEVLRSVRGTPEEGLPTILPDNIDVVDTNKLGEYEVTYRFKTVRSGVETGEVEISPGKVTVYENDEPGLAITYRDVVASTGATLAAIGSGSTTTDTGIYSSNTWHQNITVTLTSPTFIEPDVAVARYQWNKDGRWQDFCTTSGVCQVVLSKDMNETIQFRVVDTNGHISRFTTPVVIKRDNTSPYCELDISGTIGEDEWYISDVDIEFAENKDLNSGTYAEAVSGIILNNLDKSGTILNRSSSRTTITHTEDTTSVTYIGYAEDRAGNYTTCSVTFKKDNLIPALSITATRKGNGNTVPTDTWVNDGLNFKLTAGTTGVSDYTIYYCKDTANTCNPTTSVGNNELITAYNSVVGEYYIRYKIVSGSGMESDIGSFHAKVDITKPTCSLAVTSGTPGTGSWYTSTSMTVTSTFTDAGGSLVNQTGTSDETTPTYNRLLTYTLDTNENGKVVYCYITDGAGNVNSNSITLYKDDVTPTVSLSATKKTSGTEVATNNWSNEELNFKLTAGTTGVSSYTIYYCKDTANTCNPTTPVASGASITAYNTTVGEYYIRYKIVSGAGLSSSVGSYHAKVDITKPTCSLAVTSGTPGTSPWYTSASMTVTATFSDTGGSDVNQKGTIDSSTPTYNNLTTYTLSTNQNGKVVYCYVTDVAGNVNSNSITLYKDNVTPTVSISATKKTAGTAVSSGTWSNQGLDFKLTAGTTGESSYTIYYCKDTANSCNPTTSVSSGASITSYNTTTGTYYIRYKIVSGAGLSSSVGSYKAQVDILPPICRLDVYSGTAGTSPWYTSASVTVTATIGDTGGSQVAEIGTTDSSTVIYNMNDTYTLSVNAKNKTIYTYIKDGAGNENVCSIVLNKDNITPTVSISATKKTAGTAVSSGTWSNQGLDFKLTAGTTGESSYTIYYCKDTANSCNPTTSVSSGASITSYNTTTGTYYIRYKIVSGAGLSSSVGSYQARVDTTNPTCNLTVTTGTAGTNGWYKSSVEVTATFSDDGGSTVTGKGIKGPTSSGDIYNGYSQYIVLTEGSSDVHCYVRDGAGNTYSKTLTIKKDSTAPTCYQDGNSTWSKTPVTVKWGCIDSGSKCTGTTTENSRQVGSYTYNGSSAVGWHGVTYNITDNAGNSTRCDYSYDTNRIPVYYDPEAPYCQMDASFNSSGELIARITGGDEGSSPASVVITGTDLTLNDTACNSTTCSFESHIGLASLHAGDYTFSGTITDNAGNVGTCSKTVTVYEHVGTNCIRHTACKDGACLEHAACLPTTCKTCGTWHCDNWECTGHACSAWACEVWNGTCQCNGNYGAVVGASSCDAIQGNCSTFCSGKGAISNNNDCTCGKNKCTAYNGDCTGWKCTKRSTTVCDSCSEWNYTTDPSCNCTKYEKVEDNSCPCAQYDTYYSFSP